MTAEQTEDPNAILERFNAILEKVLKTAEKAIDRDTFAGPSPGPGDREERLVHRQGFVRLSQDQQVFVIEAPRRIRSWLSAKGILPNDQVRELFDTQKRAAHAVMMYAHTRPDDSVTLTGLERDLETIRAAADLGREAISPAARGCKKNTTQNAPVPSDLKQLSVVSYALGVSVSFFQRRISAGRLRSYRRGDKGPHLVSMEEASELVRPRLRE